MDVVEDRVSLNLTGCHRVPFSLLSVCHFSLMGIPVYLIFGDTRSTALLKNQRLNSSRSNPIELIKPIVI